MLHRLPKMQDVLPVYSVIATIVFGWSMAAFIWRLSGWIPFLQPGEILSILAYTFSINLLESLAWLAFFLLICVVLPSRLLRDKFAERGTIISTLSMISLAVFVNRYAAMGPKLMDYLALWIVVTVSVSILLTYLSSRIPVLASAALWMADRLIIFLFLYIPLAFLSLILVMLRNLS